MYSVLNFLVDHVGFIIAIGWIFLLVILPIHQWKKSHRIKFTNDIPSVDIAPIDIIHSPIYRNIPGNIYYTESNY
jgi:hypothetical protein